MVLYLYVLSDENLLNNVLLIKKEVTKAMVKLTRMRSTSCDFWHSLGIEPRSRNSHSISSVINKHGPINNLILLTGYF